MTKPLPTGCMNEQKRVVKKLLITNQTVDFDDKIGHLLVVNVRFSKEEATPTECMYNEEYFPIFKKHKMNDASGRIIFQLLKQSLKYLCTKTFILYLEHLFLQIKRKRWQFTRIYSHYTFKKERFKTISC